MNRYNYNQDDYEFMNSISSAVLEQSPKKFRLILWFWIVTIIALITWAYFAKIDEIVRGRVNKTKVIIVPKLPGQ